MKRALYLLVAGTVLTGLAAAYAGTSSRSTVASQAAVAAPR